MKTVCKLNECAGCMACVDICNKNAISVIDQLSHYNAVIDENKCVKCSSCFRVCQSNNPSEFKKPLKWNQGWTNDENLREICSSGGAAAELSTAFIKSGGVVCSCVFENGEFKFGIAEKAEQVNRFTGSKYVKSNPKGIYKIINNTLKKGIKVLFIGLPCQVAALNNYVEEKNKENLFTADLICHGTPSPKLLEAFLNQYGVSLNQLHDIKFRKKARFQINADDTYLVSKGVSDKYSIAFLNSLIYTENCYNCKYSQLERVSDITLGDSWGSELEFEEQKKGISLILCQTEKGKQLVNSADLTLKEVDIDKAIANNHQLERSSAKPKGIEEFFIDIGKNRSFNKSVSKQLPKQCFRQNVKEMLIKLKIIKR